MLTLRLLSLLDTRAPPANGASRTRMHFNIALVHGGGVPAIAASEKWPLTKACTCKGGGTQLFMTAEDFDVNGAAADTDNVKLQLEPFVLRVFSVVTVAQGLESDATCAADVSPECLFTGRKIYLAAPKGVNDTSTSPPDPEPHIFLFGLGN